jgi:hypothetical protein
MPRALRIGHALTSYDTSFPATENPLSQSSRWRVGGVTGFYRNPRTTSGRCFAASFVTPDEYDDCLAHLQGHAISANHYVEGTIYRESGYDTPGATHEVGLYLRMTIGEEFVSGYEFLFEAQGSFQVVRWEGTHHTIDNFFTGIDVSGSSPGALSHGDVVRVEVVDDEFAALLNGVEFASFTDDTFSTGSPGLGFFVREGSTTPANYCFSRWRAGAA